MIPWSCSLVHIAVKINFCFTVLFVVHDSSQVFRWDRSSRLGLLVQAYSESRTGAVVRLGHGASSKLIFGASVDIVKSSFAPKRILSLWKTLETSRLADCPSGILTIVSLVFNVPHGYQASKLLLIAIRGDQK